MKTISQIIKFEIKSRIFSVLSIIFFLMLVFQAIWYTKGTFDYYVNDGVLMNAPVVMYRNYSGMGMLMTIIITIVTGGVIYKDLQHKTAQWVYTFPVEEKKFYLGRFFAAFFYLLILGLGVTLGNLLLPFSGIGVAHRFGAAPIAQMLHAILIFQIPNLLLYVALIFTTVIYTRKMGVGYLACFLLVIFFLTMQTSYESSGGSPFYAYAEPMGYVAVQHYFDQVPTEVKNTGFLQLSGHLLANRLIWMSITIVLFILGYRKFSYKHFIAKPTTSKGISDQKEKASSKLIKLPVTSASYKFKDFLAKLFSLSKLEFLNIVRPTSFKIIVGILMLMVFLQNVSFNANYYIGKEVPLTSNMTYFRLPWGVFIVMLLMIWSGELFFKEKTVKIWQITDALPVPVWVTQLSKFFASCGLAFVLCISFVVICIVSQLMLGGASIIDFKQYFIDIFGYRWGFINFIFEIALVFFIAGLTGNRFLTHILSIGYFFFLIISFDMGIMEQVRYGFAITPGVEDYSEMSGYGILGKSADWFALMWGVLSVALVMLGILFWRRGSQGKWYKKITQKQLSIPSKIVAVVFIGLFIALQVFLNKNIYANGNFTLESVEEQQDADYEKKYSYLQAKPMPKYQELDLSLDYYPEDRKVMYDASIKLAGTLQDTLFLNFEDFVNVATVKLNEQDVKPIYSDEEQRIYGYLVNNRQSDSTLNLQISATKQYVGFSQSELQSDITKKGSYASLRAFLPTIGYDSERELTENRTREDNGLPKLKSRMAVAEDKLALSQYRNTEDALKVKGKITIGTSKDQFAFAPGVLVNKIQKDNRNYFTYVIEKPSKFNWHVGSAKYKQFENKSYQHTKYAIYAHPSHDFNIDLYKNAMETALTFFKPIVKDYNYGGNISLFEKHHWSDTDLDAFANTIVISEKQGWVADTDELEEKSYVYQTVAAQLATLWLNDQLKITNVQGADMLGIALPEALALNYVKETLGEDEVAHLLKKKKDKYGKDRNNEPNVEPALLYADGIEYLEYNKGGIALYKAMNWMGKETFLQVLSDWLENTKNQPAVFKDFYEKLSQKIPAEHQKAFKALFEATGELVL